MYNEEQKMRFIDQVYPVIEGRTSVARTAAITVFERLAPTEEEWGVDICTQSTEEINKALNTMSTTRMHATQIQHSMVKKYMKWCLENNIPGATDNYKDLVITTKMTSGTVSDPADMQLYLDTIFAPESERTLEIVFRCYLWMAFAGMYESDVYFVKTSDVIISKMLLAYNGVNYPIYSEGMLSFVLASASTTFVFDSSRYGDNRHTTNRERERVGGTLLLRGFKGTPDHLSKAGLRAAFSTKIRSALNDGKTDRKVTYERARLSGIFYRAWLKEQKGSDPTTVFKDVVKAHIERIGTTDPNAIANNTKERLREYNRDYRAWKEAWNI